MDVLPNITCLWNPLILYFKYRCTKGIRRRWGHPQARWRRSRARQAPACSRPAALPAHPWAPPAVLRSFRPPGGADGAEDDAACLPAGKEDDKARGAAWLAGNRRSPLYTDTRDGNAADGRFFLEFPAKLSCGHAAQNRGLDKSRRRAIL